MIFPKTTHNLKFLKYKHRSMSIENGLMVFQDQEVLYAFVKSQN